MAEWQELKENKFVVIFRLEKYLFKITGVEINGRGQESRLINDD